MTHYEEMTRAYIEAIYFTDTGDSEQASPEAELTALCRAQCYIDCRNFMLALERHPGVQSSLLEVSRLGHDLWLTRNGHGAGFWDRPEVYGKDMDGGNLADWLTAMAHAMGSHDAEFEEEEAAA